MRRSVRCGLERPVRLWGGVEFVYSSSSAAQPDVDLIGHLGGNFGIELISGGTFSSELSLPGQAPEITTGTFRVSGDRLTLSPNGLPEQEFRFTFDRIFLTLRDASAAYDFDGDGTAEPATLTILLDRS